MTETSAASAIELQVTSPEQLFNTLDPFPFRERDLDRSAEEFIVGWARELPSSRPLEIIIHLPADRALGWNASDIEDSFHRYFEYRADMVGRDLSELFRVGRRSLQIGLAVLLLSVGLSELSNATFGHEGIFAVINEGLIILGWVANWRPIEIFLYEWWPVAGHRALYRRLAKVKVRFSLRGETAGSPGAKTA